MSRQSAEESRQGTAHRKPPGTEPHGVEPGDQVENRKPHDQRSHQKLERSHHGLESTRLPGENGRLPREPGQHQGPDERCGNSGDPEANQDPGNRLSVEQGGLQHVIGQVYNGGCRYRDFDREEDDERRHQNRAEAEAGEER